MLVKFAAFPDISALKVDGFENVFAAEDDVVVKVVNVPVEEDVVGA